MRKIVLALIGLALLASGCASSYVQTKDFNQRMNFSISDDSKIPRSDDTLAILKVVRDYRNAVVAGDTATLKSLISKQYYENASTTNDTSDDYGYERIEEILDEYLSGVVKDVRYVIEVRGLNFEHADKASVYYQYIWNFRYEVANQSYWESQNDTNRITLVRERDNDNKDSWKIVSGL